MLHPIRHDGMEDELRARPENAFSLLNGANPNLGLPRGSPLSRDVDGNVAAAV